MSAGILTRRFCAAVILLFALFSGAAAVTPADLAFEGVDGRSRVLLSASDLNGFQKSLLESRAAGPYVQLLTAGWNLKDTADAAFCLSMQPWQISFALHLKKDGLTAEDIFPQIPAQEIDPAGAFTPESGLSAPSFLELGLKKFPRLFTASLLKGGEHYLIASTAGLEALQRMAAAAGEERSAPSGAGAQLKIVIDPQSLSAGMFTSDVPLEAELGVQISAGRLTLPFRLNLPELVSSVLGLRRPFWKNSGEPGSRPTLLGSGRLQGIWHFSLNFTDSRQGLSDLLGKQKIFEIAAGAAEKAAALSGLTEQKLRGILHGTVTLGISGRMTVNGLGTLPGFYLHISGLSEPDAAELVNHLREKRIGADDYEIAAWEGFRLKGPMPLAALYGSGGFLLLGMDEGEESGVPEVPCNADEISAPQWHLFQLSAAELYRHLPVSELVRLYREAEQSRGGSVVYRKLSRGGQNVLSQDESTVPAELKNAAESTAVASNWVRIPVSQTQPEQPAPPVPPLDDRLRDTADAVSVGASLLKSAGNPPVPPEQHQADRPVPLRGQKMWDYAAVLENIFVKNDSARSGVIRLDVNEDELARLLHRDFPPDKFSAPSQAPAGTEERGTSQ